MTRMFNGLLGQSGRRRVVKDAMLVVKYEPAVVALVIAIWSRSRQKFAPVQHNLCRNNSNTSLRPGPSGPNGALVLLVGQLRPEVGLVREMASAQERRLNPKPARLQVDTIKLIIIETVLKQFTPTLLGKENLQLSSKLIIKKAL